MVQELRFYLLHKQIIQNVYYHDFKFSKEVKCIKVLDLFKEIREKKHENAVVILDNVD